MWTSGIGGSISAVSAVNCLLKKAGSGLLKYCNFSDLSLEMNAYFFCFNPTKEH